MYEALGMSGIYVKLYKILGNAPSNDEREMELERRIHQFESDILVLERQYRNLALSGSKSDMASIEKKLIGKKDELAKLRKIHEQRDFQRSMRITGLGLKVERVVRFGMNSALISLVVTLIVTLAIAHLLGLDAFSTSLLVMGASITVPLFVFLWVINYPERLAQSLELEAFGAAPEMVNYMVMSMELTPSIDKALMFAAENSEGPLARELRALVWKVQTREYASTEAALAAYALELEGLNEELRSAIYNILSASKESNMEVMHASLRRASDLVLTGTRQRVEEYAYSLGTPATVLFGLGILLPMIIGSLLPMISFNGFDVSAQENLNGQSWLPAFLVSFFLMDILFPMVAFLYARGILMRRPGIHSINLPVSIRLDDRRFYFAVSFFIISMVVAWWIGNHIAFWGLEWAMAALLIISGAGISIGMALGLGVGQDKKMREMERIEDQIPDMLFQLGGRLTEGMALESALEAVAESMKGTEIGELLSTMVMRLRRSGNGIEDMLFGAHGMLEDHPSSKVKATMRLVVEACSKNPEVAGRMLMSMSNHLRELSNTDREMRVKLSSTIDSMRNTALFFAPVIMGVTVGLYNLLATTFSSMRGTEPMPVFHFVMVMGLYLLMTVAIIVSFSSGIERGKGRWARDLSVALPVSMLIFAFTSLGALLAFT